MEKIKNYPHKTSEHAITAVDVVIFTVKNDKLKVLLLELSEEPFVGKWALPGGLVAPNENLEEAADRHLNEKAGANRIHIEQLYTFGDIDRDPKGRVISVSYLALVPPNSFKPKTLSRYESIRWHDIDALPELAYDHLNIVQLAKKRLKAKLSYTNIVYSLMPKEFSLTELQEMYEVILEEKLDKRNFRKKVISLDILKDLNKKRTGAPSRPADLYAFKNYSLQEVNIL